jgi:hypothetical protein
MQPIERLTTVWSAKLRASCSLGNAIVRWRERSGTTDHVLGWDVRDLVKLGVPGFKGFMNQPFAFLLLLFSTLTSVRQAGPASGSNPMVSMEHKLEHLKSNRQLPHPDPTPTVLTEDEINAYLASGQLKFPAGVQSVIFQEEPGIITATLKVDFDKFEEQRNSGNPWLSIFTGTHDVVGRAHAHGSQGKAFVDVDSVSLDNVEIPRFVLQLFVDKYLRPRYPAAGLNSEFALPAGIDTAVVGSHRLTLTQS